MIRPAVFTLEDTGTVGEGAHCVGGAKCGSGDERASGATSRADEVPRATFGRIGDAGELIVVFSSASLEAVVVVGNGGGVDPLFAHGIGVALGIAREEVAVGDAEIVRGIPHALTIVVAIRRSDVAEFTHFLASRGGVGHGNSGELALVVTSASGERTEVAVETTSILDGIPRARLRFAITSSGASGASGETLLRDWFPEASGIGGAGIGISVEV